MHPVSRDELRKLATHSGIPLVSVFLPLHGTSAGAQQDPAQLRNLLREAEERMRRADVEPKVIEALIKPARATEEELGGAVEAKGLALFCGNDFFRRLRSPLPLGPLCAVGARFHVKPLIPQIEGDGHFFVLALSQNQVRLLRCSRYDAEDVEPPGMPTSLAEVQALDEFRIERQSHTARASDNPIGHGHVENAPDSKPQLLRYFQQVDHAVTGLLANSRAPLILAAVDYEQAIYREASKYGHLVREGIPGNPEHVPIAVLADKGRVIARPILDTPLQQALAEFAEFAGGPRASIDLSEIVAAAKGGRVWRLFVASDRELWGTYDDEAERAWNRETPQARDEDLLNLAAVHGLLTGADVFAMREDQVPGNTAISAVMRY